MHAFQDFDDEDSGHTGAMLAPRRALFRFALCVCAFAFSSAIAADRAERAAGRVQPELEQALDQAGLKLGAPLLIRLFKLEAELEVWVDDGQRYRHFRSWPICAWSGALGPKLRQGDRQAPEGFYQVSPSQMNPASRYHLSFNLGYPNAYDRAHARSGDYLMVHGNCVSIGCYAMGDAAIERIYTLMSAAFAGGQREIPVHAFPFRFDRSDLATRLRDPEWGEFWSELRAGWDAFERDRRPPRVRVVDRHYRVDVAPP
jgi:murein L,D-transpeptidase YafK